MKKKILAMAALAVAILPALAQGPNNTGAYYASANGKSGAALKTALFNIIKVTTKDVQSYDGLIDAYRSTDTRADGFVRDWYSNVTKYEHDKDKAGSYGKEGDCYNREHLIPQSWFSKASPMRSDLFHVVPTDGYVNNRRGSYPLGEVGTDVEYASANNYSKLGKSKRSDYTGTVFEPNDEVKGDIARAYFYFVTCYQDKLVNWDSSGQSDYVLQHNTYPSLTPWVIKMMMEWSVKDPVDAVELARNNAVQTKQSNRNPFVDYPGLEEYIWGSKTSVPFDYTQGGGSQTTVAAPTFSPAGGTYSSAQTVTLTTTTAGAAIYYTVDGSAPTATAGKAYTMPLTVSQTTTVKAVAVKDGATSLMATATYVIQTGGDEPQEGVYSKISSTDELTTGDDYLLVYEVSATAGRAYDHVENARGESTNVTLANGVIDLAYNQENAAPLRMEQSGSNYTLYDTKNNYYLALSSKANALNVSDDPSSADAQWKVSLSGGNVVIVNAAYTDYTLYYNSNANIFRCYSSAQKAFSLYKATIPTGVSTVNAGANVKADAKWYTLSGQQLNTKPSRAGVYINGGRKVIVK
ncbi:MAG: endonuclease [Bacteroidaceae bacterium]|nr:endonuclease [Bacteroidaceae bacterium]